MQSQYVIILKKLGIALLILLLLSFVIMCYIRLIPGDPVKMLLGASASEETISAMRSQLRFDKPVIVQWFYWIKGIFTEGRFGTSLYTHRDVSQDIAEYLPRTLELMLYAAVLLLVVGLAIGTVSAVFKNTWIDNVLRFFSYLGVVIPPYVWGILFMLLFAFMIPIFPLGGLPNVPAAIAKTGFPCLDALLAGDFALYGKLLKSMVLPILSIVVGSAAYMSRMHRGSAVSIGKMDYIAFMRVSGVSNGTLIMKHMLKPAFIPTLTIYGMQVSFMLTNLFLVENIFRYPGFARYALACINAKDPYGIVGATLIVGIIIAIANTLVDIGVAGLDPRIRLKVSE